MASVVDLVTAAQLPSSVSGAVGTERLALFITAASEALAAYVGYPLHKRAGVVESVVGRQGPYLFMKAGAVSAVSSVVVAGETVPASEYALEVGTLGVSMGRIVRYHSTWPFTGAYSGGVSSTPLTAHDTGDIVVTFDAGWVTPGQKVLDAALTVDLPACFQVAAIETVTAAVGRDGQPGDIASESIGDTSVSYMAGASGGRMALPSTARQMVERYRKLSRR